MTRSSTARRRRSIPVPGVRSEQPYWQRGAIVAGIDEVGRGAWAGPLTLACVVLPPDRRIYKLRDSKMLAPAIRERLSRRIHDFASGVGIGHASHVEIDRFGLSEATRRAGQRAVQQLAVQPDVILIDGIWDFLAHIGTTNETIAQGDQQSASIAAASIVAKVARDRIMSQLDGRFPGYDFASNKGYPAPRHVQALQDLGPCQLHRRSWAPIAARLQPQLF